RLRAPALIPTPDPVRGADDSAIPVVSAEDQRIVRRVDGVRVDVRLEPQSDGPVDGSPGLPREVQGDIPVEIEVVAQIVRRVWLTPDGELDLVDLADAPRGAGRQDRTGVMAGGRPGEIHALVPHHELSDDVAIDALAEPDPCGVVVDVDQVGRRAPAVL